jgi:all-trans-8'-apo-beta-carotenal 15,15'-oxygenase
MNRRSLLTAAAGLGALAFTPERVLAAAANSGDWTLAVADVEADIAPRALRRVSGRAPAGLQGVLFRNGPAKFRRPGGSATHWFDGDGLIRRYAISDGQATLTARFADTPKRRTDTAAGAVVCPGFGTVGRPGARVAGPDDVNAANTSVMMAGAELWALWEAGSPLALDPVTLETRGFHTFREDLKAMPFLAHPRVEPDGRVWNLGTSGRRAIVWRLSREGELELAQPIELPRASYLHDFSATERHLVLVLQPWMHERMVAPLAAGYAWRPEQGTQVLVLDKADLSRRRVFEVPAFSFFHMADAWEDADGAIRLDVCAEESPEFAIKGAEALLKGRAIDAPPAVLTRVVLRPDGRGETLRLGPSAEFPRGDPRYAGRRRDYDVFLGGGAPGQPLFTAVSVRDGKRERIRTFDFGRGHIVEEMVFAARPGGTAELDGWLVGTTINLREKATELHVFDARRVEAGPLVTWRADVALPATFHGVFAPLA